MQRLKILLVGALVLGACTGPGPSPSTSGPPSSLHTFRGGGVTFRYPASWSAYRYTFASSFSSSIAYLSNETLHPPCHSSGNRTSCGDPISQLGAGGVLVKWSESGFPGWTFQQAQGQHLTVGGHQARMQIEKPGWCGRIGADETISVTIERPAVPDNSWGVSACIRGPDEHTAEAQVLAMLQTTHLPAD